MIFVSTIKKIAKFFDVDIKRFSGISTLESNILHCLKKYDIDIVIDVGANVGQFGQLLRMLGYKNKILSFEPDPVVFLELSKKCINDSKWECINSALGEFEGKLVLHRYNHSTFSSMREINKVGEQNFPNIHLEENISVEVKTLNYVLKGSVYEGKRIFLKLDTQGYDLEVFKGSVEKLSQIFVIMTELSFIQIYNEMPNWSKSISYFQNHNYILSGIYHVSRGKNLELIEADAIFIKK